MSETETPSPPSARNFPFSSSAAATIAVGSPSAPAITAAVWPSAATVEPRRGGAIEATSGLERSVRSTRATTARKPGSPSVWFSECAAAHATPHAWGNDAFSDLLASGAGLADVLPEIAVLLGYAAVLLALAVWRLHTTLTR